MEVIAFSSKTSWSGGLRATQLHCEPWLSRRTNQIN
jgi:hypothetical protein